MSRTRRQTVVKAPSKRRQPPLAPRPAGEEPGLHFSAPGTLRLPARWDRLDALRGAAMLWMAAFHFSFDLNQVHWIPRQNFYADPFWTWQRIGIVSLFVGLAGVGQGLGGGLRPWAGPQRSSRVFWRRWAEIAVCALLVSAASWWMFPRSFIFFGVLHGMAVMLLMMRGLAPVFAPRGGGDPANATAAWDRACWMWVAVALVCLVAPRLWQDAFFDSRWTTWIGLGTRKPVTEDFAPILPWFGVFALGLVAGDRLRAWRAAGVEPSWMQALTGGATEAAPVRALAALGRWPLSFYMVHQPVLIGLLQLAIWARG